VLAPDGELFTMQKSTAFEAMDQIEFKRFFNDAAEVICTEILPGISKQELADEIREMLAPSQGGYR
jgi:hypothetical protein